MRKNGSIGNKTKQGMVDILSLFKDKTNPMSGLTKFEFISLYYNINLETIMKMNDSKLETKWNEIANVKKSLLRFGQAAIVSLPFSRGTVLNNEEFGERILEKRTFIFFKCVTQSIADGIRDDYDKIAMGYQRHGNQVSKIAREYSTQKEVIEKLQVANGNSNWKLQL